MNHLRKGIVGVIATLLLLLIGLAQIQADEPSPFIENFEAFNGSGLSPSPAAGQLDSALWRVSGFSDGDTAFDGSDTTGDLARGASTGGVNTGGLYAFDTGGGNVALGLQPADSLNNDFNPGDITLRLKNIEGLTVTSASVAYQIWYHNDQNHATTFNFAHATDDSIYTHWPALDFTTPLTADTLGGKPLPVPSLFHRWYCLLTAATCTYNGPATMPPVAVASMSWGWIIYKSLSLLSIQQQLPLRRPPPNPPPQLQPLRQSPASH